MDSATLLESVREQRETELDRLGSEKALLAATEARLEPDAVLGTTTAVLADARETVDAWARAADEPVAGALRTAADRLAGAHERVTAEREAATASGADATGAGNAPLLALAAEGDVERLAAATVGAGLVLDRLFLQSVSFFVNEADTARADLFRDLRETADDLLAEGQAALDERCRDSEDWERATGAVTDAIDAAYADYVERLDTMGFDPKPIC